MNIRPKDRQEVEITLGEPLQAKHFEEDKDNIEFLIDAKTNEIYGMGGVSAPAVGTFPIVWLLCTKEVEKHPVAFLRFAKAYNDKWTEKYKVTTNWVWLGNDLHVKWLKWMGAIFLGTPFIINGEKFQRFEFCK